MASPTSWLVATFDQLAGFLFEGNHGQHQVHTHGRHQLANLKVHDYDDAEVRVDRAPMGACGTGLMILVCAMQGDGADAPAKLAAKVAKLRIFTDENSKMNRSLRDIGGEALVVSQFTLAADTTRGNRPGFSAAAPPETGRALYEAFAEALRAEGVPVQTGRFGVDMKVSLVNDGPVTVWIEV